MIPKEIPNKLNEYFNQSHSSNFSINSITSVEGGSINKSAKLDTNIGNFFIKWNKTEKYPKMFEKEVLGLNTLANSKTINTPKIYFTEELLDWSFLLMEYILPGNSSDEFWIHFGRQMAQLHKTTSEKFGFEEDNFIGSLQQRNNRCDDWSEFFWGQRIEPQLKLARNSGLADRGDTNAFETLYYKLDSIFPEEKPALLHGDFWKGNYIIGNHGIPYIVDPAVYFGHREMDIAMSSLFGGFSDLFYKSYSQEFPLEKEWEERVDLWNLYPLLVHVNLFGETYMNEVRRNVRRFI